MILLDEIADRALTFTFTLEWNVVKLECLLVCLLLFSFSLYLDRSRSFVFLSSTKRECRAEQSKRRSQIQAKRIFNTTNLWNLGLFMACCPVEPFRNSPKVSPP